MPWTHKDGVKMEDTNAMNVTSVANSTPISSNATTVIKTGAGVLYGITVDGIGTLSTLTAYDNTAGSGTTIGPASIVTTALGLLSALGIPSGLGVRFNTGLTIVTAGTGAATLRVFWA